MYLCLKDIRSNVSLLAVVGNFRPALRVTHLYGHILSGICQRQPRRRLAHGSPNVGGLSQPNLLPGRKSRSLLLLLLLLLFSLLISNVDASEELVAAMGCVSLCAGSFTAGFVAAKRRRCKGLLIGLACGIAMYLVTFLIGLLLLQSFAAAGTFSKLIFMVLCSCIGGVVGVNTKCRVPRC